MPEVLATYVAIRHCLCCLATCLASFPSQDGVRVTKANAKYARERTALIFLIHWLADAIRDEGLWKKLSWHRNFLNTVGEINVSEPFFGLTLLEIK